MLPEILISANLRWIQGRQPNHKLKMVFYSHFLRKKSQNLFLKSALGLYYKILPLVLEHLRKELEQIMLK